jgi:hypothetical protein
MLLGRWFRWIDKRCCVSWWLCDDGGWVLAVEGMGDGFQMQLFGIFIVRVIL